MSDKIKQPKVIKSDEEWQQQLTTPQYSVTRLHATETPFSSPYNASISHGTYSCICCGEPLFASEAKFDSGTGWPSFHSPVSGEALDEHEDSKLFMKRTEVRCASCDSHLGHVFPDGPDPSGLRYCINGVALNMKKDEE